MRRAHTRSDPVRVRVAILTLALSIVGLVGIAENEAHREVVTLLDTHVARAATIARSPQRRIDVDTLANARRTAVYVARREEARAGETTIVPVVVRNLGETVWPRAGAGAVRLAYHLYDASGALVTWDGARTELPRDIGPGESETVVMLFHAPGRTGRYTVRPDLIREGVAWFSSGEAPAGSLTIRVSDDLDATYDALTTPAAIVPGGEAIVDVRVHNDGFTAWQSGGDHPVRLAYHWIDASGGARVWDGPRAALGRDLAPGDTASLAVSVRAPDDEGTYTLVWDMVEEGVGWFSGHGVPALPQTVTVARDLTLYGKGWGHGIGLSQWGAQGWAQGAAGPRLTGEQIAAKYFPLASLDLQPASRPFRVLLSAPSTGCVGHTIWNSAHMRSAGGMRLVNDADPTLVYLEVGPDRPVRFGVVGDTTLVAVDEWTGRVVFEGEGTSLTLVPAQWWDPIEVAEKGLAYRGNLLVQVRDDAMLRVVNYVASDDYMKGTLPGEMPGDWEMEALRAQAITARTYAAWRQATAGDRTWDVRDDTADQCYGGRTFESPRTTRAVESTPATILTYGGRAIRALFSASDGGITENVGCLLDAERAGGSWRCAEGWPYLEVVDDPAEALARDARGGMPHQSWIASFSGAEIREQIIEDYGVDIGAYVSLGFNMSPGGRPISVRVAGTHASVDLKGDRFLRATLGLKSTLVRTFPF